MTVARLAELGKPREASTVVARGNLVDGIVTRTPEELLRDARRHVPDLTLEQYSLSRLIQAEGYAGKYDDDYIGEAAARVAEAQAVVNEAKRRKVSITTLLTGGDLPGYYGAQGRKGYAATSRDSTLWDCQIAQAVLSGDVPDLARGATNFLAPSVWGNAEARGVAPTQAGNELSRFASVIERWGKTKAWTGSIPGVDSYHLALFRYEKSAEKREDSMRSMLAVYDSGVLGRNTRAPGHPDGSLLSRLALVAFLGGVYGAIHRWIA